VVAFPHAGPGDALAAQRGCGQSPIQFREVLDSFVTSYSASPWHVFFVGMIGASAALTGLLFGNNLNAKNTMNLSVPDRTLKRRGHSSGFRGSPLLYLEAARI
jgi:hypothetical protein